MIVFMERNRIMANNGFKMTAHIHGLDGLRTLAIAGVTLFHLLSDEAYCLMSETAENSGF